METRTRPGTHDMRPVYGREGAVIGFMCNRCAAGTFIPEDAEQMHGKLCHETTPAPWGGIALVALSIGAAILAGVSGINMYFG